MDDTDAEPIYCVQSKITRIAYLLADSLCEIYKITPEAGKHCPMAPEWTGNETSWVRKIVL